jgi:hypothetical protein
MNAFEAVIEPIRSVRGSKALAPSRRLDWQIAAKYFERISSKPFGQHPTSMWVNLGLRMSPFAIIMSAL